MPKSLLILIAVLLLFAVSSCSKITLDDGEEVSSTSGSDSDEEDTYAEVYTVADLSAAEEDSYVWLDCFIVGYAKGSKLSGTVFSLPDDVYSNIVVADSAEETDYKNCAAAQLEADSSIREDLNLVDNPDNLGQEIWLYGLVTTYFGYPGLRPVANYLWIDEVDEELIVDSDDEESSDEDSDTSDEDLLLIPILTTETQAFEGC